MLTLLKSKVVIALIGALVVGGTAGTVAVVEAQNHSGVFAPGGLFSGNHAIATHTTSGSDDHHGNEFHAQGTVQHVTFQTGNTSGILTFLPQGSTKVMTVQFTAQTHVETNDSTHQNASGLKAGLIVTIEGTIQTDGTILAKEIQSTPLVSGTPTACDDRGTPEVGDDRGTPEIGDDQGTPKASDDHGTPVGCAAHGTPEPEHGNGTPEPNH